MDRSLTALNTVNFLMADVRDGLGPFLGVYLQADGWSPQAIGIVMTIGGLAGMVASAPLGAVVDRIQSKRSLLIVGALATIVASLVVLWLRDPATVTISQVVAGIAGALIAPAISGITLGLVGQRGFARQTGHNEAFNHAGNVAAAVLAGSLGYLFGFGGVFAVLTGMGVAAAVAATWIDPKRIDHRAARGLSDQHHNEASSWSVLLTCKPLLLLSAVVMLFHLGNAAMLPLLGQALVARGAGDANAFTGATIVVAQLTMVPMAILAARLAITRGYWLVMLLALVALPIRGLLAGMVEHPIGLVPVQILDGVAAGLIGVAVPGLVARILDGTGHINAGLGAVMALQGLGASLSPALGGTLAEAYGYAASFIGLGIIALLAVFVWLAARSLMQASCAPQQGAT